MSKSATTKGVTAGTSKLSKQPQVPSKVPTDDRSDTIEETCSDKLDNKPADKPTADPDLAKIIATWPKLPELIRSAIVAIARDSRGE